MLQLSGTLSSNLQKLYVIFSELVQRGNVFIQTVQTVEIPKRLNRSDRTVEWIIEQS